MSVNEYFIRTSLWPAMLFTILVMITGILGNGLIIYIYRRHFHRSVPWLFIYVLSILDILACVISMPSEIMILATFGSFPSHVWCKVSRYLSFTFHGSSCVILMAIALNRYEKVCRPNNQKLNLKRAKIFCTGTIIFACVSYIPCLLIYGEFVFPLVKIGDDIKILPHDYNMTQLSTLNMTSQDVINGTFCIITKESSIGLVLGFYLFQFLLYVILVVLIIFFYSRVIRKIVSYGHKQQQLLTQMVCQASRTDHIRKASKDHRMSIPKEEPSADFSKDFSRNEISTDGDKRNYGEYPPPCSRSHPNMRPSTIAESNCEPKASGQKQDLSTPVSIAISPPILEEGDDKRNNPLSKQTGSEGNIQYFRTSLTPNDPLETNQLLMRRFKSSEDLKVRMPQLQILPPLDPYEAMFEPLFLHAPKTHKKKDKGSIRKSKKGRSKSVSRSKSNIDISFRMLKPTKNRNENSKSLEGLATLHCGTNNNNNDISNIQDGTLTLTRRTTPKGSKNCIIPISTTLSVKSVVSYNALDLGRRSSNQSENGVCSKSKETIDTVNTNSMGSITETVNDNAKDNNVTFHSIDQQAENGSQPVRRDTVSFKPSVTVISQPKQNKAVGIMMRRRSESSSKGDSRNSEEILTPPPRKAVDYQRRLSIRPIRANRTSRILFWISLAFVLSFLPFWIIVIVRTFTGPNIMAEASPTGLGAMSLFIRFTLISNAINPVIYGLMNSQFRNRCSAVLRRSVKKGTYN